MQTVFAILILVLTAIVAVQATVARRFRARILELVARLHNSPPIRDEVARLPEIVVDFAHRAGARTGGRLRLATCHQAGEIRLRQGAPFSGFSAWQVVSLGSAGFVWDARLAWGPFTRLRVIDSYVDTEGHLEARLFGTIPVARAGGADTDLAEAYRYLAELPWCPDAILGNRDLDWRIIGAATVEVRLATQAGTARVTFRFDADGDIVEMQAKDRPALDPSGTVTRLDWRGRYRDYEQIGDRRLPRRAEVGYDYPTGYESYFRAAISEYRLVT